jgi:glycosyltransferase involved in cell wall biosynthesis
LEVFKPVNNTNLRSKLNLENKFIILGVASIWSNYKGLDKFIKLSKSIEKDMVILLIGGIKNNIALPENIIKIEETHNVRELVEYYSAADLFLNLSLEETFGKVTAEALACGTPAIAINSTANPELIGEGCGFVVDNNINSILESIKHVKRLGKSSFSKECISYARNNFSKVDRIKDYMYIYNQLVLEK